MTKIRVTSTASITQEIDLDAYADDMGIEEAIAHEVGQNKEELLDNFVTALGIYPAEIIVEAIALSEENKLIQTSYKKVEHGSGPDSSSN